MLDAHLRHVMEIEVESEKMSKLSVKQIVVAPKMDFAVAVLENGAIYRLNAHESVQVPAHLLTLTHVKILFVPLFSRLAPFPLYPNRSLASKNSRLFSFDFQTKSVVSSWAVEDGVAIIDLACSPWSSLFACACTDGSLYFGMDVGANREESPAMEKLKKFQLHDKPITQVFSLPVFLQESALFSYSATSNHKNSPPHFTILRIAINPLTRICSHHCAIRMTFNLFSHSFIYFLHPLTCFCRFRLTQRAPTSLPFPQNTGPSRLWTCRTNLGHSVGEKTSSAQSPAGFFRIEGKLVSGKWRYVEADLNSGAVGGIKLIFSPSNFATCRFCRLWLCRLCSPQPSSPAFSFQTQFRPPLRNPRSRVKLR